MAELISGFNLLLRERDSLRETLKKAADVLRAAGHDGKADDAACEALRLIKHALGVSTSDQLDADVARLMAMSEAEIDAELRSMGMDPAEAELQGKAAVESALAAIRKRTSGVPVAGKEADRG